MFDVDVGKKSNFNQNSTKKKHSHFDKKTKTIFAVCLTIFLIVFLVFYVINKNKEEDYKDIKENKKEFLVYTKYKKTNTNYKVFVPYVNIQSDIIKQVNKDIDLFTEEFISAKKCSIIYEYSISGIILSVVVKVIDYTTQYAPDVYFRSYNINLSTLEVISDEALLDFFGTDYNNVEVLISEQFKLYHQEIVEEGYYHQDECNYNCFLNYRGIDDYMDNVVFYVKNGDLVAYKSFVFFSIFGEEEYFEDEDYEFLIVKTDKN